MPVILPVKKQRQNNTRQTTLYKNNTRKNNTVQNNKTERLFSKLILGFLGLYVVWGGSYFLDLVCCFCGANGAH